MLDAIVVLLNIAAIIYILYPSRKYRWVKDFPCNNWAGTCSKHCGYCEDKGQWAYRKEWISE